VAGAGRERSEPATGIWVLQRYVTAAAETTAAVCLAAVRASGAFVASAVKSYQQATDTALRSTQRRGPEGRAAPGSEGSILPGRSDHGSLAAEAVADQTEHRGLQAVEGHAVSTAGETGARVLVPGDTPAAAVREQAEGPDAATDAATSTASAKPVPAATAEEVWHADGAENTDAALGAATDDPAGVPDAPPTAPSGTAATPADADRSATVSEPRAPGSALPVSAGVATSPVENTASTSPAGAGLRGWYCLQLLVGPEVGQPCWSPAGTGSDTSGGYPGRLPLTVD
jgi:hypothetical protein